VDREGKTETTEGCLSIPDVRLRTERNVWVEVKADNWMGTLWFGPDTWNEKNEADENEKKSNLDYIESIAVQHECLPRSTRVLTEDGKKRIKDIVDEKYEGKVLSYDGCKTVWKNIIGWSARRNTENKNWITVRTTTGHGTNQQQTVATEDHPFAVVNDPFDDEIYYTKAKNTKGKYIVRAITDRKKNKQHGLYNDDQLSIIYGSLLGDMCISERGTPSCNHGECQSEYSKWKAELLNGHTEIKSGMGYAPENNNVCAVSSVTEQTKKIREEVYRDKKVVTDRLIENFNEISLSFWYMDDGCFHNSENHNRSQLHVEGFNEDCQRRMVNMLYETFQLNCSLRNRSGGYNIIQFSREATQKLHNIVAPYVHESMKYKLDEKYRDDQKYKFDKELQDISLLKVKEIYEKSGLQSKLYDIEIEDTHCFFANQSLVHNCDHLQGKTIYDREVKQKPFEKSDLQKLGRNDKVFVENEEGDEFEVKWKYAKKHDDWTVLEIQN
jgi:recombination protein RecA